MTVAVTGIEFGGYCAWVHLGDDNSCDDDHGKVDVVAVNFQSQFAVKIAFQMNLDIQTFLTFEVAFGLVLGHLKKVSGHLTVIQEAKAKLTEKNKLERRRKKRPSCLYTF